MAAQAVGSRMEHAAVIMTHDDNFMDMEFVNGNHQTADDTVKIFKGRIAGDFDDFGITADEAHSRFQKI